MRTSSARVLMNICHNLCAPQLKMSFLVNVSTFLILRRRRMVMLRSIDFLCMVCALVIDGTLFVRTHRYEQKDYELFVSTDLVLCYGSLGVQVKT